MVGFWRYIVGGLAGYFFADQEIGQGEGRTSTLTNIVWIFFIVLIGLIIFKDIKIR
jgi:hypothetical protein